MSVNVSTIEQTFQVCADENVSQTVPEVAEIDYGEITKEEVEKYVDESVPKVDEFDCKMDIDSVLSNLIVTGTRLGEMEKDAFPEFFEPKGVSTAAEPVYLEDSFVLSEYPLIQSRHKKDPTLEWTSEELVVKKCWSRIQSKKDKERIAAKKLSVTFATEPTRPSEAELDEMYIINEYPLIQSKHKKDPTLEWTEEELKVKKSWSELQSKNDRQRLAAKKSVMDKRPIAKLVSPDSMEDQLLYQTTRLTDFLVQGANPKTTKKIKKFLDMIPHVFSTISELRKESEPLRTELSEARTQMEMEIKAIRDKYAPVIDPLVTKIGEICKQERVYRTSLCKVCFHDYGVACAEDCSICYDRNPLGL